MSHTPNRTAPTYDELVDILGRVVRFASRGVPDSTGQNVVKVRQALTDEASGLLERLRMARSDEGARYLLKTIKPNPEGGICEHCGGLNLDHMGGSCR
jgi:hypothetical protein